MAEVGSRMKTEAGRRDADRRDGGWAFLSRRNCRAFAGVLSNIGDCQVPTAPPSPGLGRVPTRIFKDRAAATPPRRCAGHRQTIAAVAAGGADRKTSAPSKARTAARYRHGIRWGRVSVCGRTWRHVS